MNVTLLQPLPQPSNLQRSTTEPAYNDADFLALKLLNKRARVRLSPEPLDLEGLPCRSCLFAVANLKGCFAAVARDRASQPLLTIATLADLRSTFASQGNSELYFASGSRILVNGVPHSLSFSHNGDRLVVALTNGSLLVYDTDRLLEGESDPVHTFFHESNVTIEQVVPNPGDLPELIAVLRADTGRDDVLPVEVLDVQSLKSVGGWKCGSSPDTKVTTLSWSPKGKQLALALESGDIVSYSPASTSEIKTVFLKPQEVPDQGVIAATWLSNTEFYTVYSPRVALTPEAEQNHYIVSLDPKTNTAGEVTLAAPYLPFPGLRPPGQHTAVLRGWASSKFLVFVGDGTSSDIGLIGNVVDPSSLREVWCNLSLEETSTPSVPLDKESNDTVLVGLGLDLTAKGTYLFTNAAGEESDIPAPPIVYAYASDGTLIGWHVIHTQGVQYPGMIGAAAASSATSTSQPAAIPAAAPTNAFSAQPFGTTTAFSSSPAFGQTSTPPAFGQTSTPSAFGQASFGQTPTSSVFGQTSTPSAFGQISTPSVFGQPSTPSAFGQTSTPSAFGQTSAPSAFSQPSTSTFGGTSISAFGGTSGGGFSAFAGGTSKFGQTSFGFGPNTPSTPPAAVAANAPPSPSSPTRDDNMDSDADDHSGLGSLSLGRSDSKDASKQRPSIFGQASSSNSGPVVTSTPPATPPSSSVYGGIKPAAGFGAFGSQGSSSFGAFSAKAPSAFGTGAPALALTTPASTPQPVSGSAFGQSAFGQSSFGQPTFGKPAFGQSSFGKPAFGQTSTPAASTSSSATASGGGFSAFAEAGPTTFGSGLPKSAKPAWATSSEENDKGKEKKEEDNLKTVTESSESSTKALPNPSTQDTSNAKVEHTVDSFAKVPSVFGQPADSSIKSASVFGQPTDSSNKPIGAFGQPSTAPAITGGAFGQLKTSAFGFGGQVGSGFGAFGSGHMPSSSPFFKAATKTDDEAPATSAFGSGASAVSAFALSGTQTSATHEAEAAAKPTFGMPSALGAAATKPVFGSSTMPTPSTTPTKSPSNTNVFSAFSGPTPPFGAAASSGSSFSALLRATDDKEKTNDASAAKTPVSVFASLAQGGSMSSKSTEKTTKGGKDKDKDKDKDKEDEQDAPDDSESDEDSDGEGHDAAVPESQEDDEDEDEDEESFLSDSLSEESDLEEVPITGSPLPTIEETGLSDDEANDSFADKDEKAETSFTREKSTTPPSSPTVTKPVAAPQKSGPLLAPPPIGLGRPSTRPTRSSPLASAPINGDDEEAPPTSTKQADSDSKKDKEAQPSKVSRPKTPPLLSMMKGVQPSTTNASTTTTSLLSQKPIAGSVQSSVIPPVSRPTPPVFSLAPSTSSSSNSVSPPILATQGPNLFGASPPKPGTPATTSLTSLTPTPKPVAGPFSVPPPMAGSVTPGATVAGPSTLSFKKESTASPKLTSSPERSAPTPEQLVGERMQAECVNLFTMLSRELEELHLLADRAAKIRQATYSTRTGARTISDLEDDNKWIVGDLPKLQHLMQPVNKDLAAIESERAVHIAAIQELESHMLKASTRKEEIKRFDNASKDPEFARMLKARTLGPEHLETQHQLRRDIRELRDRLQLLEDHVQVAKKRLRSIKTGKAQIKPPSLDTINRIYRNIDTAIEAQEDGIARLRKRTVKVTAEDIQNASRRDERRLSQRDNKRLETIPNVALSTAAALNAEMSANRLKQALLKVRNEPKLNTQALLVPPAAKPRQLLAPKVSETPIKVEPQSPALLPSTPSPQPITPTARDVWQSPGSPGQYKTEDSPPSSGSRLRITTGRHHAKPVQLKKGSPQPTATTTFDWGPLPVVTPPKQALPFSFDVKTTSPPEQSQSPSLSSSWVTEDFAKK